jgi:hypothetical protein
MSVLQPSSTSLCIQRLLAVAGLTIKTAFRFKLIPWLLLILTAAVFCIPYLITHDGTAEMFAQVQLTYSLMAITLILGISTVWLSCGVMTQDFERHHIILLVSKPVTRWEIWTGKWLGIFLLNAALMIISGVCIYTLLMFHARGLSSDELKRLQTSTLTSRASIKETPPDVESEIEQLYKKRAQDADVAALDPSFVREKLREEVQWLNQLVKPQHRRIWNLDVGSHSVKNASDALIQLRVKFYASWFEETNEHPTVWVVGNPDSPARWEKQLNLSPMTTHEWSVPASLIDTDGILHVECHNYTESSLVFKVEDGLEVLVEDGSFLWNYTKGLVLLLAWMTLLSALGLWAATFASLPVATFIILTLVLIVSSEQLLKSIVVEGTVSSVDEHSGNASWTYLDWLMVPLFTGVYHFTETLRSLSPIERLVTGRNISTMAMLQQLALLCGLLSGLLAGCGIYIFQRKELGK